MASISMRCLTRGVTSLLISSLLLPCCLQAQLVSFAARRDFPVGNSANSVTVADLNNDGNPDLVILNQFSGVSVMLGNGNGTFQAPISLQFGFSPGFITVADVNGDNKPDLLMTNPSSNISIAFGRGDGTFSSPVNVAVDFSPAAIAVADFNGDGKPDLAVACGGFSGAGTISVLLGNGDGSFKPRQSFSVASNPSFVVAADLNGDGRLDLAVANYGSNNVSILLGRGDGTFLAATNVGVGIGPKWLAIADFNGDHFPDLAVADSNSDEISILLGRGDGTFLPPVNIAVASGPVSVASSDLNGDNIPDLVIAHSGSSFNAPGSVSVLVGNGDGSFQAPLNYAVSGSASAVAIADFNRDGVSDLVVSESINSSSPGGSISEFLGNGDGTFQSAARVTVTQPVAIAMADFDGDGRLDVAVISSNSSSVLVFLGNGDGTFQPAKSSSTGNTASSVVVGDFNNDGIPDLAVSNFSFVAILLGNGDGTFQAPRMMNLNLSVATLAVADFDSDGRLDLAVAGGGFGSSFNGAVLLGNGDGSFQPAKGFSTGTSPISGLAVGDFNGDLQPDVVVANSSSDTVSVLLGNGDGTFSQQKDVPVGRTPGAVAVGDINGDGFADIAVANSGSSNVSVLLGDGNGSFQAAFNFDVGTNPQALTFGDFNNDGRLDLAVANQGSNSVSILINSAGGALAFDEASPFAVVRTLPAANFGVGVGPAGLVAGDLNGDSLLDLVTVDRSSNTASVLINNTVVPVP